MTHDAPPTVTVVLPTRDRPDLTREAVLSVLGGTVPPLEVLVVDQSAHDHPTLTRLEQEHPGVRRVPSAQQGLSRARNLGVAEARGQIVAFLDDDERAAPAWLPALRAALVEGGTSVVVTGRVVPGEPEQDGAFVPATAVGDARVVHRSVTDRDVLAGGNMAAWTATLRLHPFDERLGAGASWPAAEDNDLGLRLLAAGHEIVYEPEATLVHRAWRPGRGYPLLRWRYGVGKGGFYAKHARWDGGYGLRRAGRDLRARVANVLRHPLRPGYVAGEVAYAVGMLYGGARWLVVHRRGEPT